MFLKCDKEGCTHREDVIDYNETLIGKLCPLCGCSLLKEEDFILGLSIKKMIDTLEEMGIPIRVDASADKKDIVTINGHKRKVIINVD